RRHTRSKRDWSSDVCSSDLGRRALQIANCKLQCLSPRPSASRSLKMQETKAYLAAVSQLVAGVSAEQLCRIVDRLVEAYHGGRQIGRASCRKECGAGAGGAG